MGWRRRAGGAASCAAALLTLAAPLHAQSDRSTESLVGAGSVTLSLLAGGSAFSKLQSVTVDAGVDSTYPAELAIATTTALGMESTYWIRSWIGVRVQAAYAPAEFQLRMREDSRDSLLGPDAGPSDLRFSDVSVYTYSAALLVDLPFPTGATSPYAFIGVGGSTFLADDAEARGLDAAMAGDDDLTRLATVLGAGLRVPLRGGRVALSFEFSDQITRTPVPANDDRVLYRSDAFSVLNAAHPTAPDDSAFYVHDISFFAGLVFRIAGPSGAAGRTPPQ